MSSIPLNLTPTFQAALRRLTAAGLDRGVRLDRQDRRGLHARRVATGFADRAIEIERVPAASDRHSIACGSEIIPGDEILFIESTMRSVAAHRRARRSTDRIQETEVVTGEVAFVGFTETRDQREVRLRDDPQGTPRSNLCLR